MEINMASNKMAAPAYSTFHPLGLYKRGSRGAERHLAALKNISDFFLYQ